MLGNFGANYLDGRGGADRLIGLAGDDTYIVGDAGDSVVEAANGGNDIVFARIGWALSAGAQVETLATYELSATDAIYLIGNEFGQDLLGNFGANYLDGRGGADRAIGLAGDDTYIVGDAGDSVVEGANGGNDIVFARIGWQLTAGAHVETLSAYELGATDAIYLIGNELGQDLLGNFGANYLDGGGGDRLIGLAGDDTYIIGDVGDSIIEAAGGGNDAVYSRVSWQLSAGAHIETLAAYDLGATNNVYLIGNEFDQDLLGNFGANWLDGRGGIDRLIGLGGDDTYIIGDAGDSVVEAANGGNDAVYARVSWTLSAGAQVETLATYEFGATDAIDLVGNEFGQDVIGNEGANRLDGGAGADRLIGLGGNDQFAFTTALGGGNIDQILAFAVGGDTILLDDAVFSGLGLGALAAGAFNTGSTALDADDRILYDAATGALYFDADGAGGAAAVQFATLGTGLAITANEFTVI